MSQVTLVRGRKPFYNTAESSQGLILQTMAIVSGWDKIKEAACRVIRQNITTARSLFSQNSLD